MSTTPEGWFRNSQKDLYELCRLVDKGKGIRDLAFDLTTEEYFEEVESLFEWFAAYLPNLMVDYCLPSEYSGIIHGPSFIVADFDVDSLLVFNEYCNHPDFGWMVAKRHSYDDLLARVSTCQVLLAPMSSQQRAICWNLPRLIFGSRSSLVPQQQVRWWDTPEGFVLISASTKNELPSEADAWWVYQQQESKMSNVKPNKYPHGAFYPKTWQYPSNIVISYDDNDGETWSGKAYKKDQERINALRVALGVLEKASDEVAVGDL